jgi:tetratricopeptide (TPR) repeat protein
MPKVFISHSSADCQFVENEVIALLNRHQIDYWYSKNDISGGEQWVQGIIKALRDCDWFLVVLSPSSVDAKYVRYEVSWALDHLDSGRIIPILHRPCEFDKLHFGMSSIQHIDFTGRQDPRKARTDLLKRWGVDYVDDGDKDSMGALRARSARPKIATQRLSIVALLALVLVCAVSLAVWLGRRPSQSATPLSTSEPANTLEKNAPIPNRVEERNRLLIATFPGLRGNWWFDEARWLAPAFRAAVLSAPPGTFDTPIDVWEPTPAEVYNRLRTQLAKHDEAAHARWGWLIPAEGAQALGDEQLTKLETKIAANTDSFKASDWHTLAVVRHHLAVNSDHYVNLAEEAYNKAIEAYQHEGEKRLLVLCRNDFASFLIVANEDAMAIPQIELAEKQLGELEATAGAKMPLALAYLRLSKSYAFEDLFDWAGESHCLDEAERLLGELPSRPTPHPLQATIWEQRAWLQMWQWDVRGASGLFAKAREMRSRMENTDPESYLEKLNDLHGEAIIERFLGNSRKTQVLLRAIVTDIDGRLDHLNGRGKAAQHRSLIDRKLNCLERIADCDIFDDRPAEAIRSVGTAIAFGRENALFQGDRSSEVRLLSKYALAYALTGDHKNADSKISKALALDPKNQPDNSTDEKNAGGKGENLKKKSSNDAAGGADLDDKARFYAEVVSYVVDLAGEESGDAGDNLREVLRAREEKLDSDIHELLLLATQRLIIFDRQDSKTQENADEDADLLLGLIAGIPQESRKALHVYLGRAYETALSTKLDDASKEVDDGIRRWAIEAWLGPNLQPPSDRPVLLFFFEDRKGHALLCPPNGAAIHFPLKVGRLDFPDRSHDRKLPLRLVLALKPGIVLVYWRPLVYAPDVSFPFDPPPLVKFEF